MNDKLNLSVIVPLKNEEGNVIELHRRIKEACDALGKSYEIIFIDDGSKDKTGEIAENLSKEEKRIRVISHKPNRGYGGALKSGYDTSKYEWVAFADADGQFDFSEIKEFIEKQKETDADLVLGIRVNRADSLMRKLFTFVWAKMLPRILLGLKVTDYSCGFKLVRRKVYGSVQPLVGEEKVTQIEMLTKAQRLGFKFAEVGVHHYPRKFGHQTGADLKVVARSLRDLLKLWWQLK